MRLPKKMSFAGVEFELLSVNHHTKNKPKIKLTNTCYEQTQEKQTFIVSKGTNQLFEIEVYRDDTSDDIERKIAEKAKELLCLKN